MGRGVRLYARTQPSSVIRQPSTINRHPSSVIRHPSTIINQLYFQATLLSAATKFDDE